MVAVAVVAAAADVTHVIWQSLFLVLPAPLNFHIPCIS